MKRQRSYSSPACFAHELPESEPAKKKKPASKKEAVRIKRVYDEPARGDGYRVLVDRLWPRGLSKARAAIDAWERELSPSTELRQWYAHDPAKWDEFRKRYRKELLPQSALLDALRQRARRQPVTLLYSSKEQQLNNAAALKEMLEKS